MKISELIIHLNKLKDEHGDVIVVTSENDEYWGSIEHEVTDYNISFSEHVQPEGPKSGKSEKGIVFNDY